MGWSLLLFFLANVAYNQALPLRLLVVGLVANGLVIGVKVILGLTSR